MELETVRCSTRENIQISHMQSEGDYSYAKNSSWQKNVILKTMPLIQESIDRLFFNKSIPECFKFADLGCSSGPTAYMPTWQVIEALESVCRRLNCKPPTLHAFLNDLPGNDFNSLFKLLPSFYDRLEKQKGDEFGQCFIAAVPGSFYGRLFPNNFLHLMFSSYTVNWLSQTPIGLVNESGVSLNKENIYLTKTSPHIVHKAYLDQFESDFTIFLRSRQQELEAGGRLIFTFMIDDTIHPYILELLGMAIYDMVSEGLIEESKLEKFNVPFYMPRGEEIRAVIEKEGSFDINQIVIFNENWVLSEENKNEGKAVADRMRAVMEPLLVTHFGSAFIDDMFHRFSLKLTEYLESEEGFYLNWVLSLIKK